LPNNKNRSDIKLTEQTLVDTTIPQKTNSIDLDSLPFIPSRRHRIRMNRFFRETVRSTNYLPFPEVDNTLERLRSRFIIKFSK